jgi:hypothetical protein
VILGRERQRGLQDLHRPVGAIDRHLIAQKLVPGPDATGRKLLHLLAAKQHDRFLRGLRAFAGVDDRAARLARRERPDDVTGLKGVGAVGDRSNRSALGFEPRGDSVGDGHELGGGAIRAPLKGRDKLGAPLLGVTLAFEETLLPVAGSRVAPVQDVASLLDGRAVFQLSATDAASEVDVERHGQPLIKTERKNTARRRAQLFRVTQSPPQVARLGHR